MTRYQQLAHELTCSIQTGLLKPGDKLPSVRQTSQARKLSAATVFQAYYLLEARGLIVAQPRSGYFVAGHARTLPQLPQTQYQQCAEVTEVDVSQLVFEVLESTRARQVVPLGSAFPSPLLFPLDKLARCMSYAVLHMDPWLSVRDLSPGDAELRRQIALRYLIDGLSVSADEIVITNGALEALNLCLQAVTKPGDAVCVVSPSFYAALQAIERNGLRAIEIPCHPQHGIDLVVLEHALSQHHPSACWMMSNFQNPTGYRLPDANKRQLVALLARFNVPLIEDDVYGELYFGEQRPKPAKAYDQQQLVMHCSSFSKCLAPGYRVGWVAPGRYAKTIERLKLSSSLATSVPAQLALAAYLQKGLYDRHLRQLRQNLMLYQIRFLEAVQQYFPAETCVYKPDGGYFIWLKLPDHCDALKLYRQALAQGISIAPGPIFSALPHFNQYIRLNYGHGCDAAVLGALRQLGALVSAKSA